MGNRDGAVVRAIASHQCGSRSIPGHGVICAVEFVVQLVLVLAPTGFSPSNSGFPISSTEESVSN